MNNIYFLLGGIIMWEIGKSIGRSIYDCVKSLK